VAGTNVIVTHPHGRFLYRSSRCWRSLSEMPECSRISSRAGFRGRREGQIRPRRFLPGCKRPRGQLRIARITRALARNLFGTGLNPVSEIFGGQESGGAQQPEHARHHGLEACTNRLTACAGLPVPDAPRAGGAVLRARPRAVSVHRWLGPRGRADCRVRAGRPLRGVYAPHGRGYPRR
jgi:hypothetical protein